MSDLEDFRKRFHEQEKFCKRFERFVFEVEKFVESQRNSEVEIPQYRVGNLPQNFLIKIKTSKVAIKEDRFHEILLPPFGYEVVMTKVVGQTIKQQYAITIEPFMSSEELINRGKYRIIKETIERWTKLIQKTEITVRNQARRSIRDPTLYTTAQQETANLTYYQRLLKLLEEYTEWDEFREDIPVNLKLQFFLHYVSREYEYRLEGGNPLKAEYSMKPSQLISAFMWRDYGVYYQWNPSKDVPACVFGKII